MRLGLYKYKHSRNLIFIFILFYYVSQIAIQIQILKTKQSKMLMCFRNILPEKLLNMSRVWKLFITKIGRKYLEFVDLLEQSTISSWKNVNLLKTVMLVDLSGDLYWKVVITSFYVRFMYPFINSVNYISIQFLCT